MNPHVLVMTNDRYLWAIRPFVYLFQKYWSELQPVTITGFQKPDFTLPNNIRFESLGSENYPASKWSDSLIASLRKIDNPFVVILLEDYWLMRTVDCAGVASLTDFMSIETNIIRMDLTTDRLHARGDARDALDYNSWGHYDVIVTPSDTPYQLSLQAAVWNRELLLSLLVPNKSPWEVEIHTSVPDPMLVCGTRQWPVRYVNAIYKGAIKEDEIAKLHVEDYNAIKSMIPNNWRVQAG